MGVNRPGTGITSPTKIIANIFVSFIGAGMLGLPFAFKESGIMEGALIMAIVGYLSVAAMLMLIDCKYAILSSGGRAGGRSIIMDTKVPLIPPDSSDDEDEDERHPPTPSTDLTYGDVGLYAFGPGGKRLVDMTIVISQIGFCCGYLIYLCKNLNMYIPQISQRVWLILLIPPLYSLTLLRHLNRLAVFSLFAQVSNVFALAVVFWFDFSHSEKVPFRPKEFSLIGFPFFFAVAIYCYEGAGMILSLEESVAENRREKFRPIFICTMTGLTTLYICFGVSGYASFGRHTKDIITLNLPHGNSSVDFAAMVKICLGISLFFTYPMMMFPVTHLLDKTFGFAAIPYRGNIMRLVLVIVTGLVVSAVTNFAILMGLIGATCCTLLAFILPAAFHLAIFKQRLTKRQWYFDVMLIFLGITGSIIGVWDAFNRMNGHDALLEVNEFSPLVTKNGTFHSVPLHVTAKPVSNLSNLATTVHSAIAKLDQLNEVKPTNSSVAENLTEFMTKVSTKPTMKQTTPVVVKEMTAPHIQARFIDKTKVPIVTSQPAFTPSSSSVSKDSIIDSGTGISDAEMSEKDKTNQMLKQNSTTAAKIVKDSRPNEGKTKESLESTLPTQEKTIT